MRLKKQRSKLFGKKAAFLLSVLMISLLGPWVREAWAGDYQQVADQLSQTMKLFSEAQKDGTARYDVVFKRDPMRTLIDEQGRLVSARGLSNGLTVQGILHSQGLTTALINDQFYHEGDTVGAYKILEIRSDGLKAQWGDKVLFIPLYPDPESGKRAQEAG